MKGSDGKDTYVCLLLHVLIGDYEQIVVDDEDSESISKLGEEGSPVPSFWSRLKGYFKGGDKTQDMVRDAEIVAGMDGPESLTGRPIAQHYYPERRLIYDEVKSTRESNLTVAVEQVSIFLTSDATVITFFQVARNP